MTPAPIYSPGILDPPSYHLRYTWTGWPSSGEFPAKPSAEILTPLYKSWEADGIRHLESNWSTTQIQTTCSVVPVVSPVLFTSRIKGRLQHALRQATQATKFSRKVAFRSIGNNSRKKVEAYIAKQVTKAQFVDSRFSDLLSRFTTRYSDVRLEIPIATDSGRYWYNLHLVLVTESRMRMTDEASLKKLSELCVAIAKKKGYQISAKSVMPDHLHLAVCGDIMQSPQEIALVFMNNTAFAFGQKCLWRPSYYVGTFGEYDMGAVRGK